MFMEEYKVKSLKKVLALVLALVLTFCAAACHPKDETAITINGVKFTSAMYLACMVNAYSEAMQKVNENASTTVTDYTAQTIDNISFNDWVKNRALEQSKQYAALEALLNEGKFKFSDEDKSEAAEAAEYYWNSYGYSTLFEKNGVSYNTYKRIVEFSYLSESYFLSLYGKDGTEPVGDDEFNTALKTNYEQIDRIATSFTDDTTDTEKESKKKSLEDYAAALNSGKKEFAEVFQEFNSYSDEDMQNIINNASSQESAPKDIYSTVTGGSKTSYSDSNFAAIKAMDVGTTKVFTASDGNYQLVLRGDIMSDSYYKTALNSEVLHLIKDDTFDQLINDYIKKAKLSENSFAINRFKPDDIDVSNT